MRALMLTARFHPAKVVGAVRWTVLTEALAERGVDVGVICRRYPSDGTTGDDRVVLELGPGAGPPSGDGATVADGPSTGATSSGPAATLHRLAVPDTAVLRWRADERRILDAARAFAPDVVVSTSPPHGIHLVAARVARRLGLPHVVELRDPYVGDRRYDVPDLAPWRWANRVAERRMVARAAAVVALGPRHRDDLVARHPELASRIHLVPNGFHPSPGPGSARPGPDDGGADLVVMAAAGRHELQVLAAAAAEVWAGRPVRLHTVGLPAAEVGALRPIIDVVEHPWVPTDELAGHLRAADVLLLALERANGAGSGTSTKLYQYLAAGRPIVAVNPTVPDRDLLSRWSRAVVLDAPTVPDAVAGFRTLLADDSPVPDRRRFEAEHAWPALADRMAAILAGVVHPG